MAFTVPHFITNNLVSYIATRNSSEVETDWLRFNSVMYNKLLVGCN